MTYHQHITEKRLEIDKMITLLQCCDPFIHTDAFQKSLAQHLPYLREIRFNVLKQEAKKHNIPFPERYKNIKTITEIENKIISIRDNEWFKLFFKPAMLSGLIIWPVDEGIIDIIRTTYHGTLTILAVITCIIPFVITIEQRHIKPRIAALKNAQTYLKRETA